MIKISERIKAKRLEAGVSTTRLAGLLGISVRVYENLEMNPGQMTVYTLLQIAEILEVSYKELLA